MTSKEVTETKPIQAWKVKILGLAGAGASLVSVVSAGDINDSVSPVIQDVVTLMPSLLDLVMGALPIIIALAVVGFLLGLFDGILGKIKL